MTGVVGGGVVESGGEGGVAGGLVENVTPVLPPSTTSPGGRGIGGRGSFNGWSAAFGSIRRKGGGGGGEGRLRSGGS